MKPSKKPNPSVNSAMPQHPQPQPESRQLFLPGMEEFIAKLDRQSKPNRKQST